MILPSILWRVESFLLVLEFTASVERYLSPERTNGPVSAAAEELNDAPAHLNYETVPELCVNACGEKPDLISLLAAFTGLLIAFCKLYRNIPISTNNLQYQFTYIGNSTIHLSMDIFTVPTTSGPVLLFRTTIVINNLKLFICD